MLTIETFFAHLVYTLHAIRVSAGQNHGILMLVEWNRAESAVYLLEASHINI